MELHFITPETPLECPRLWRDFSCADVERAAKIRDFAAAFRGEGIHVIAELKKASPSKGLIRADFDAAALARELEASGAAALSVLAEPHRFLGGEENVRIARANSDLPILFKDFVSTDFQILRMASKGSSMSRST